MNTNRIVLTEAIVKLTSCNSCLFRAFIEIGANLLTIQFLSVLDSKNIHPFLHRSYTVVLKNARLSRRRNVNDLCLPSNSGIKLRESLCLNHVIKRSRYTHVGSLVSQSEPTYRRLLGC